MIGLKHSEMWVAYIYGGHEVGAQPYFMLNAHSYSDLKKWLENNIPAAKMLWDNENRSVEVLLGIY